MRAPKRKPGAKASKIATTSAARNPAARTPAGWIALSRAHWAGVENRNHWRRDATLGEDGTRLRNGRALIHLALLRSACLRLLSSDGTDDWLPAKKERLANNPTAALALVRAKL